MASVSSNLRASTESDSRLDLLLRAAPETAKIRTMPATPSSPTAIRIWDLPTRLFHWMLAAAVFGALTTAWIGGNAMIWHLRCGLTVLALVVFRLVWGLVGGRWSRFGSFLYAPATVLRYLRGEHRMGDHFEAGHNPLGSLSVFAVLGFLAVQVGTGLFSDDEIAFRGPLNHYIGSDLGLQFTHWHSDVGVWIVLGLVGLHIAAIVYHRVRKQTDLVRPMLTGDKTVPPLAADTPASIDTSRSRAMALLLGALCAGLAFWVARLGN
jgi:cytochrome b